MVDGVVIGGGPAGVEAALTAASSGASVRLVADSHPGDWGKMLPSRVWLSAIDEIARAHNSPYAEARIFDPEKVMAQVSSVTDSWRREIESELQATGVEIVPGWGEFRSSDQVDVRDASGPVRTLRADFTIIATGASPVFPPGLEPDSERVFSPATLPDLGRIPESILVIGDACIGFEFVDLFSQLGVDVAWIVLDGGPRSGFDREIDEFLLERFRRRGVKFSPGSPICLERGSMICATRSDGTRIEAQTAFINIGHRPNIDHLNLEAAGVKTDSNGMIATDECFRTSVPTIYAVGDALRFWAGNVATGEAKFAASHAVNRRGEPFDAGCTIIPFGYNPQAAKVGIVRSDDGSVESSAVSYKAGLMAHVERQADGLVRVAWDRDRRIVGAHAVGPHAADVLAPIAMAMKLGGSVDQLSSLSLGHPYYAELAIRAIQGAVGADSRRG